MKKLSYIVSLAAMAGLLFVVGCAKNDADANEELSGGAREVKFKTAIPTTKIPSKASYDGGWENNDPVGVYMKKTGTTLAAGTDLLADNIPYTVATDGTMSPVGDAIIYPMDGTAVDFVAYYPGAATVTDFALPVDLSDQSTNAKKVLLYSSNATNKTQSGTQIGLTFVHQYTRIKLNVIAGAGMTDAGLAASFEIKITNVPTMASFDLASGTFTGIGTADQTLEFIPDEADAKIRNLSLIPGASDDGAGTGREITFEFPGMELNSFEIPDTKAYLGGSVHTYNVTVSRDGVKIGEADIAPWDPTELPGEIVTD